MKKSSSKDTLVKTYMMLNVFPCVYIATQQNLTKRH